MVAEREKFGVPAPRKAGPLSVDPPSQAMMWGFMDKPRSKELSGKPEPMTPQGESTRASKIEFTPFW